MLWKIIGRIKKEGIISNIYPIFLRILKQENLFDIFINEYIYW